MHRELESLEPDFESVPREIALGSNERVLWVGNPTRQLVVFRGSDVFVIPFTLIWGGFALIWNLGVWVSGAPLLFRLWGLPFLLIGLYITVGRFLHNAYERRNTTYVLTADQAVIVRRVASSTQSATAALGLLARLRPTSNPMAPDPLCSKRQSAPGESPAPRPLQASTVFSSFASTTRRRYSSCFEPRPQWLCRNGIQPVIPN